MDVKIGGKQGVMAGALEKAREGRLYILQKMKEILASPRESLATHAPRIFTLQINPEKIRQYSWTNAAKMI
jgi:polyribonucleotide nucleotidyltransferase